MSHTEIVIIADRSGSMSDIIPESVNSINRLIEEQKKVEGKAKFTLAIFDDLYEQVYSRVSIDKVEPLTEKKYFARGMTALYDAIGETVDYIERKIAKEEKRPDNIIVNIITDGLENASQKYTQRMVSDIIKRQQDVYGWEFIFIGANIDAYAEGQALNIRPDKTYQFEANDEEVNYLYDRMSHSISEMRKAK